MTVSISPPISPKVPELRVGIIPLKNFTMLAFAGFIDTLRLAADEGDRSRQIRCQWTIMSEGRQSVRASNGTIIQPTSDLTNAPRFDYVVVVGGTLHETDRDSPVLSAYLKDVAETTPLVGLCNGVLTLARAGLMKGRRACVSWFHHLDYVAEFPELALVSDRMFLVDGNRITCPGGVSSIHLASWLVEKHLGVGAAAKGLRIMLEDSAADGAATQPLPALDIFTKTRDQRVRKAVLAMERMLDRSLELADLARLAGSTPRHLSRLFVTELGLTPKAALERMRLAKARRLITDTGWSIAQIAVECGFADASHLTRRLRASEGITPGRLRDQSGANSGHAN